MNLKRVVTMAISFAVIVASALAMAEGKSVVVAKGDLKWKNMGVPGVEAAQVSGDMQKDASRFFLKYPVGLVTPKHYHTADHYVTVVSGTMTLSLDGKDHKLPSGSYVALTEKMPHIAKVEGNEDVVLFIQSDGPWDVVIEK
jgi:mannose-6-phosphate isomerase-like protein (cupin superfamily)